MTTRFTVVSNTSPSRMASPSLVRLAVLASLTTTGGAIFYCQTDGGDPQVAQDKLLEAQRQFSTYCAELEASATQLYENASPMIESIKTSITNFSQKLFSPNSDSSTPSSPMSLPEPADSESVSLPAQASKTQQTLPMARTHERAESRHPFCHTCSGPRIWFFAEKLRLKRRLTPYPDPPAE